MNLIQTSWFLLPTVAECSYNIDRLKLRFVKVYFPHVEGFL